MLNHRLGPFILEHPFILAPMAGITHSPFRRLMREYKSALVISELISANGFHYNSEKTKELSSFHASERPIGIQIFGETADALCAFAQALEQQGVDFIDLNLGCPVTKVVKKGAGAALCKDPKALFQILAPLVKGVRIPVSIKIRTGWDANTRNADQIVQVASDAGVAWVAIHGRTRAQGYAGLADWEYIGNIKAKSSLPIAGNGDILTATQANEKLKTYNLDAVYIGRATLKNPFLFQQCVQAYEKKPLLTPSISDYLSLLSKLRHYLEAHFQDKALLHSKKFCAWFSSGFPQAHDFRKGIFTIHDPETLWKTAHAFFAQAFKTDLLEEDLKNPFLMGGHG